MHAEELRHKPIGTITGVFLTLGIVFGVLFSIFVVNFLQYWLGIYWLTIVLFALIVLLAFLIVKKMLLEYIYLIEKDRISFGRKIGKREKELLFVPLREILSFGPYEEMQSRIDPKKKRFKYTFKKKQDWYVVNCTGCTILISPTQDYINCLKQAKNKRKGSDSENPNT